MAGQLKVTLVKSAIGSKPKARGTLRALGLRRIKLSKPGNRRIVRPRGAS